MRALLTNLILRAFQVSLLSEAMLHAKHATIVHSLSDVVFPLYVINLIYHYLPLFGISLNNADQEYEFHQLSTYIRGVVYMIILYTAVIGINDSLTAIESTRLVMEALFYCMIMELVDRLFSLSSHFRVDEMVPFEQIWDEIKMIWKALMGGRN